MKHGKLYTCSTIPHVSHFNKAFNTDLRVCEKDYIDIFKVDDAQKILDFLAKPVPFCRYCNPDVKDYSLKWEATKKDINEWT